MDGIAIVGMAVRFPGARSVEELWRNLVAGVESIRFFTAEELAAEGVPPALAADPAYVPAGAPLPDADRFDAALFGFTPREAAILDPQARLFLECAFEALEDAGYAGGRFPGAVGVFGGVGANGYFARNVLPAVGRLDPAAAYQAMIANDKDFVPSWVSYKLNLEGPSVAVQTSCSTSLVAAHLACQSLLNFECDLALAGGASLAFEPRSGYLYQEGGILSPDGHCRPFDAAARGTVRGSGAGIVALRRLAEAARAGDPIVAVIRGSAVNNDGAAKVGFTAPSVRGQAEVIAMAQAVAGVSPDTIGYVEGHGTATPLGDPIEVAALAEAFRRGTARRGFCALGSIKSNFGHLDTAAGVAGLVKAALAVERGQIPPTLHFREPNPGLSLAETPFSVNASLRDWPAQAGPRRAGVSSFGIGGTNAHAVLEQAPARRPSGPSRPRHLLALSARTPAALEAATDRMVDFLDEQGGLPAPDVAFTLLVGRRAFEQRRVVLCRDLDDAADALEARDPARVFTAAAPARERPLTFLFPGQGSQYPGMGREVYEAEPRFREELDRAAELLAREAGFDVRAAIFPAERTEEAVARLSRTEVTQPALFALEYALARFVMGLGVAPQSLIGHSIGEYVAACLAGVFSLADAVRIVAARGRLMGEVPPGAMLAVAASEAEVKRRLPPAGLSVAVVNSPSSCVVAGTPEAVSAFAAGLARAAVAHRPLAVSHAFHSHMMDGVLPAFRRELARVRLERPRLPFVSNLTGTWIRPEEATDPDYWVSQLRRTVCFADGLGEILKDPDRICLEVGPGRTLATLCLQQKEKASRQVALTLLPDARERTPATEALLSGLGRLWVCGVAVDWPAYFAGETRNRVRLPTYPFERERYWLEPPAATSEAAEDRRREWTDWLYAPVWRQAPLPAAGDAAFAERRRWLVFADEGGLGEALGEALAARGQDVVRVRPGREYQTAGGAFGIRPREAEDYSRLLADLVAGGGPPDGIVHLWGVTGEGGGDALGRGFHSVLWLARALAVHCPDRAVRIVVVNDGVQTVTGEEPVDPRKAAVLGPCLVVGAEQPGLVLADVDLEAGRASERAVAQLLEELAAPPADRPVAFRGRFRWVLDYEPMAAPAPSGAWVRAGGVYWITGGLGGIGLAIASSLARRAPVRLVLTSRAGLPPREQWDRVAAEGGAAAARVAAVRALEAAGAEVLVEAADTARRADLERVAALVRHRFGAIDGAVHAAGIAGGRLAERHLATEAEAVLAPKLAGAENLLAALAGFHPGFVVLCSSLSAHLGGLGQSAYAGANAFLDALARHASLRGMRVVAIDWDRWRSVGMAARAAAADPAEEERAIAPEEGVRVLDSALALGLPQVVVSTTPLAPRLAAARSPRREPPPPPERHARPALATDYAAPSSEREQLLASLWRAVLGLAEVGVDDNFFELGGDSLTALSFAARYKEAAGVTLAATTLYQAPTIRLLARALAAEPVAPGVSNRG